MLLQLSDTGLVPPLQVSAPPEQVVVPGEHAPIEEPQLAPPSGLPSSVIPSQSSSTALQSSVEGPLPP